MKKISELVVHMNKHKDAIIIVGPGVQEIPNDYTNEEFNEHYNRKNLVRNPEDLWKFFNDKMHDRGVDDKLYTAFRKIEELSDVTSLVLTQTMHNPIIKNIANLHGSVFLYTCQKCKNLYTDDYVYLDQANHEERITSCELCEGKLRPTALLSGERYDQLLFDNFKNSLLNTHTLILVGMDYSEESLLNLIADYGDIKAQLNADGNPENERVIVSIQSEEEAFDPNDLTFCEFLVKGDIIKSIDKLIKEF